MSHDQGVLYVRSPRISSRANASNAATASQLPPRRPCITETSNALLECSGNASVFRERYNAEQCVGATLCPPGDDHTNALLRSLMDVPAAPLFQAAHSAYSLPPLEGTNSVGLLAAATSPMLEELLTHAKPEAPLAIDRIGLQRPQLAALDLPHANPSEAVPPSRPCWKSTALGDVDVQPLYARDPAVPKLPHPLDIMPKSVMHMHGHPPSPPELLTPGPLRSECPQERSQGGQSQLLRSESMEAEGGDVEGDGKPTSHRLADGSRGRQNHDGEHEEDDSTDGDETTYDRSARKRPAPRQRTGADRKELCRERNRTAQRRFRERQRDLIRALQEQVEKQSVIIQELTNRLAKFEKTVSK